MIMRTTLILRSLSLIVALSLLTSCSAESVDDGKIHIVVTTSVLGDIVNRAFGTEASVATIMPGGADPHEFEPSARQVAEIRSADLVVANGLGLEEGLEDVLEEIGSDALVEVGPQVEPIAFDESGVADPHVWLDPLRMIAVVDVLAERLGSIDASVDWQSGASAYQSELLATDQWVTDRLASIPPSDRVLVTGHQAFGYFADRYGFDVIATVLPGATTMVEPSASGFAEVVSVLESSDARAVFTDIGESQALAEQLVQQVDRDVLVIPLYSGTMSEDGSGPGDYLAMMRWNAEQIALGLER